MSSASKDVLPMTSIVSCYYGLFKGLYDATLQTMFDEGRQYIADGDWLNGKKMLERAFKQANDIPEDKKTLSLILSEIGRLERAKIDADTMASDRIDWGQVAERGLQRLHESFFEFPQSVFFLHLWKPGSTGTVTLLGRKLLTDMWIKFRLYEVHCSFVTADMILGVFVDQRLSDSQVTMFYHPLTKPEKLRVIDQITTNGGKNSELVFPFPLLRESTRRESGTPAEGWRVDDAFDVMLGLGEERIRRYTVQFLQQINIANPVLYDPACSTGKFLASLKEAFPGSYTIGQDLSQSMIDIAKDRVDEAHCGNALVPKIDPGSADVVFIRFINSEVVLTTEAEGLLLAVLPTVKPGGYLVMFGHTVTLLSSSNFRSIDGFTVKQCVGCAVDESGIFQYYVLQRK